jgi:hypothetical protein
VKCLCRHLKCLTSFYNLWKQLSVSKISVGGFLRAVKSNIRGQHDISGPKTVGYSSVTPPPHPSPPLPSPPLPSPPQKRWPYMHLDRHFPTTISPNLFGHINKCLLKRGTELFAPKETPRDWDCSLWLVGMAICNTKQNKTTQTIINNK